VHLAATNTDLWHQLFGDQAEPPAAIVLVTAAAALFIVFVDGLWRPARNVITIVHEAGHALTAVLAGRRLSGIRLHSDTSGLTLSRGKPSGPGMVMTAFAGYPAPSLLGLLFAGLLAADKLAVLLTVCALLVLGSLVMIRNAFGILLLVLAGAVLFGVSWFASDQVQAGFGYLITWLLLLGGLRPLTELQRKRRRGHARDSDADQLARLTGAPGLFWIFVCGLIGLGCLGVSAAWLLV